MVNTCCATPAMTGGVPPPSEWDLIRNQSESSNTVMVNDLNHLHNQGGGITEGFVEGNLEYASGYSGTTLWLNRHQRNFIFVKPQDGKNGYFILVDEIDALFASDKANVALHPNSAADPVVIAGNQAYQWDIQGCNYSGHPVGVTIFLGTNPESVSVRTGYKGSYSACSRFYGKYLYATYATDETGYASTISVIFPHDDSHAVASMNRIAVSNASGALIDHGDSAIDYVLGSESDTLVTFNGVSYSGLAAVYRNYQGSTRFFFVRQGSLFDDGSDSRIGFESDAAISIYMNGRNGTVISPGTNMTLYYPELHGVEIDGQLASITDSGPGWIEVFVEPGNHDISLASTFLALNDNSFDMPRQFALQQNFPNPFNPSTTLQLDLPEAGEVQLTVSDILGRSVYRLASGYMDAGYHRVVWHGENNTGYPVPSGIYIARLVTAKFTMSIKMVLLR